MRQFLYRLRPVDRKYLNCTPDDIGAALQLCGVDFSNGKPALDYANAPYLFDFRTSSEISKQKEEEVLQMLQDYGRFEIARHSF